LSAHSRSIDEIMEAFLEGRVCPRSVLKNQGLRGLFREEF